MGRLIHMNDWERQETMEFWLLQERGFYAEPAEIDLPTFNEVRDQPELILMGQAV